MKFRENLSVRRRFLLVALLIVALMVVAMSLFLVHKRNATPRELAHINALCSKDIQRAKTLFIAAKKREKTYDEDGRWFLKFLSLKLKVKENSDFKDDEEVLALVDHYEGYGDDAMLSDVYYCAGCVYRTLNDYPKAVEYFMKIVGVNHTIKAPTDIEALCYYQLAYIYSVQGLDSEALKWQKKALQIHESQGDLTHCVYDYNNMAWSYMALGYKNKALKMLLKARGMALKIDDAALLSEVDGFLANYYNENGPLTEAKKFIDSARRNVGNATLSSTYSLSFEIYDKLGLRDSAAVFCNKVLQHGSVYAKRHAYWWLTVQSLKNGDAEGALGNFVSYKNYVDSVDIVSPRDALASANAMYDYELKEKENLKLEMHQMRQTVYIIVSVTIAIIIALLSMLTYFILWRRKRLLETRMEILNKALEREREQKEEAIAEKEMEMEQMRRQLAESKSGKIGNEEQVFAVADRNDDIQKKKLIVRSRNLRDKKFLESEVFKKLMLAISGGENVKFEDWDELFATVNRIYPSYKDNIAKFCRMSEIQMKVCVLLKIGVSFSDISVLVIRSKDTIYSICTRLYFKNFKTKGTASKWAELMRSL